MPRMSADAPTMASQGLTSDARIRVDGPRAGFQLADEAVVEARESASSLASSRLRSPANSCHSADRQVADERLLDLAEPAHEPRQQRDGESGWSARKFADVLLRQVVDRAHGDLHVE